MTLLATLGSDTPTYRAKCLADAAAHAELLASDVAAQVVHDDSAVSVGNDAHLNASQSELA